MFGPGVFAMSGFQLRPRLARPAGELLRKAVWLAGRKRSRQLSGRQRCPKCRRRKGCGRGIARQHHAVPTRRMCITRRPVGPTKFNRTRLSTCGRRRQNILGVRRVDKQGAVCTGTPHILCVCVLHAPRAHHVSPACYTNYGRIFQS